jgi:hypothetical protein
VVKIHLAGLGIQKRGEFVSRRWMPVIRPNPEACFPRSRLRDNVVGARLKR